MGADEMLFARVRKEVDLTRFWSFALSFAAGLLVASDASAQCRIEGIVQWADGTPATAVTISIPELKRETQDGCARSIHVR